MSRIPPLDPEQAGPEAQALFEQDLQAYDQVLNTTAVAAHRAGIATAVKTLGQAVAKAGLIPDQLRFLVNVRVAGLVGCPF
jgi:hypothetical protein